MRTSLKIQLLGISLLAASANLCFAQDRFGGLSLYTLRADMKADAESTLKAAADAGYKYIEVADYRDGKFYGMSPETLKSRLSELGLVPLSAHMGIGSMEEADQMIADVKAAGFTYFVIPVPPMGNFKFDPTTRKLGMTGDLDTLAGVLTTLGEKCREAGLELLYHNHNFEYEKNTDGVVPIEYFMENTDPRLVNFQIDLYWVVKAGADPLTYFEKYPGRFKIWHVKDMDDQGRFAPVGAGTIDFAKILEKKEVSGMQFYIVEQDQTYDGMKPLEAIKISHEGLKKFGFN